MREHDWVSEKTKQTSDSGDDALFLDALQGLHRARGDRRDRAAPQGGLTGEGSRRPSSLCEHVTAARGSFAVVRPTADMR
jgi:hypothetical protein